MPDPEPTIRRALPSDRDDLARLSTQLGYPMSSEEAEESLAQIANDPNHALLVAADRDRAVGWIQVSLPRIFEAQRQAEIAGLVVDEAHRGRGVGGRLVAEAERWARANDCRIVRVRSNVIRERAHGFYRRAGYAEIKTQRVFEKRL